MPNPSVAQAIADLNQIQVAKGRPTYADSDAQPFETTIELEPETCSVQVYPESFNPPMPPEFCEEPAAPGSDRCVGHGGGE